MKTPDETAAMITARPVARLSLSLVAMMLTVVGGGDAAAQVSPTGGHHFTATGGATGGGAGAGAAIALDLPRSRKGLPLPLSIVNTGSARVGMAGVGWDVPISSVRVSTDIMRRKPAMDGAGAPLRLFMTVGGNSMMMVPTTTAGTFQPMSAPNSFDLVETRGGYIAYDASGTEYVFTAAANLDLALRDTGLFLLTEIRDSTRTDSVAVRYAVDASGCHEGQPELRVAGLSYSPNSSATSYGFYVDVDYVGWRTGSCNGGALLDVSWAQGSKYSRSRIVSGVRVRARNNLAASSAPVVLREYILNYEPGTEVPRLERVDLAGEGGVAGGAPILPLARYDYGTVVQQGTIAFETNRWAVPRPNLDPAKNDALSLSATTVVTRYAFDPNNQQTVPAFEVKTIKVRQLLRDMTGDGIADLVVRTGSGWWLWPGRADRSSMALNEPPTSYLGSTSLELGVETVRSAEPYAFAMGLPAEDLAVTKEVWTQLVDFNGDGRLDIVDVRGGSDANHWRVRINKQVTGNEYAIQWIDHQMDVSVARTFLRNAGFTWGPSLANNGGRLPISRSKTSANTGYEYCDGWSSDGTSVTHPGCQLTQEQRDARLRNAAGFHHFDTISEWKLLDLNGDSYPDFVANNRPLRRADSESNCLFWHDGLGSWGDRRNSVPNLESFFELWSDGVGTNEMWCVDRLQLSVISPEIDVLDTPPMVMAFYNQGGVLFPASTFAEASPTAYGDRCGLEQWWHGPTEINPFDSADLDIQAAERVGDTWFQCGFMDTNADGLVGRIPFSSRTPYVRYANDRHTACEDGGTGQFTERQTSGLLDMTGDGMSDHVYLKTNGRWYVRPNKGVEFGDELRIVGPFQLSLSSGTCDGTASSTHAAMDLDGDGRPESVRINNGVLYATSIVGADGGIGAHSAGRLVAEHNGFGATRVIEYTSAKRELPERLDLPFPEIVVSSTRIDVNDGRSIDPTRFAYGDAQLRYDPFIHRWRSAGYARRVVMSGEQSTKGNREVVTGVVNISETFVPTSYAGIDNQVLVGAVTDTFRLEGDFLPDPWPLAAADPANDGHLRGGGTATYDVTLLDASTQDAWLTECYDVDPFTGLATIYFLCSRRAVPYITRSTSWHGRDAPTENLKNVESATRVLALDNVGRPIKILNEGDTRRSDDNSCIELSYATPAIDSHVRSAIATRRLTDCGRQEGIVYGGERYEYDSQPSGTVGQGLLTRTWVELHESQTGAPLGEHLTATVSYGSEYALPTRIERSRALGTVASAASDIEYDPWGYTPTRITQTASDASTLVNLSAVSVLPSIDTVLTEPNGEQSVNSYDAFGRTMLSTVRIDGTEYKLNEILYNDSLGGRSTTHRDFLDGITARPTEVVTHLDALGRERYTQRALGVDYAGASVLTGVVEYDGAGRVVFAAAPIACATTAEDCLGGTHYGTSVDFLPGGRMRGRTSGWGRQVRQRWTVDADEIYPTTYAYQYLSGQLQTRAQGPVENTSTHLAEGVTDITVSTATGQVLELRREQPGGAIIERTKYAYDALGHARSVTRFGTPNSEAEPVVWTSTYDSLGQRLTLTEPASSTKYFEYDEWGGSIESRWLDGAWTRKDLATYDGYGRISQRVLSRESNNHPTVTEGTSRYFYDVHSGSEHQPAGDLLGRLSHMQQDDVMETFFGYDAFGRENLTARVSLSDQLGRVFTTRRDVDLLGRVQSIGYDTPGLADSARYHYDTADRTTRVEWNSNGARTQLFVANEIDILGRYRSFTLGNGVTEERDYAAGGRQLLDQHVIKTATDTYSRWYTQYDAAARIVQRSDKAQPLTGWTLNFPTYTTYTYDQLDRLTAANAVNDSAFSYDPLGNMRSVTQPGQAATTATPDIIDRDRIATATFGFTGHTFLYDGAGNVKSIAPSAFSWNKPRFSYSYDSAHRAVGAGRTSGWWGGIVADIRWDASGGVADIDVKNSGFGSSTLFSERRYGALIRERWVPDLGGLQIERIVPGPVGELAKVRSGAGDDEILYTHNESNGPRMVTDTTGRSVQLLDYGPFGSIATDTGDTGGFDYVNDQFNYGTTLDMFGVSLIGPRFYHASTGRFLQRDPVVFDGAASSANPYAFSFNDPINYSDPSGMSPVDAIADVIGGALSALTGYGFTTYGGTGFGLSAAGVHGFADGSGSQFARQTALVPGGSHRDHPSAANVTSLFYRPPAEFRGSSTNQHQTSVVLHSILFGFATLKQKAQLLAHKPLSHHAQAAAMLLGGLSVTDRAAVITRMPLAARRRTLSGVERVWQSQGTSKRFPSIELLELFTRPGVRPKSLTAIYEGLSTSTRRTLVSTISAYDTADFAGRLSTGDTRALFDSYPVGRVRELAKQLALRPRLGLTDFFRKLRGDQRKVVMALAQGTDLATIPRKLKP